MEKFPVKVALFTIPQAACDAEKANWEQTAKMVGSQLKTKFGEAIQVEHIEFMSPEWFQNEQAQKLLESGEVNFPFVLVNEEVACADKKINISKINKVIQTKINT